MQVLVAVPESISLGDFIRQQRKTAELTQAELAHELTRLGFPTAETTVSGWENGDRQPPLKKEGFPLALARSLQTTRVQLYKAAGVFDDSPSMRREVVVNLLDELTDEETNEVETFIEFVLTRRSKRRDK